MATLHNLYEKHPVRASHFHDKLSLASPTGSLDAFIAALATAYLKKYARSVDDLCFVFREAIKDAAYDDVTYIELRFALSNFLSLSPPETLIQAITEAMRYEAKSYNIDCGLILTLKRDDDIETTQHIVDIATGLYRTEHIIGLDLAGNEHLHPNEAYTGIAKAIHHAGIPFTVHAGEVTDAASVRTAIELLGARRIGHGTRAAFDPQVMELVAQRDVLLEVCPTSNLYTSAYSRYEDIPIRVLLDNDVPILICTDDPVTCGITLTEEIARASRQALLTEADYQTMASVAKKWFFRQ